MTHRKIYTTDAGVIIRESGTSRTLAILPHEPLFERREPSESLARQIKHLPAMMDYIRSQAFHGSSEAARLLEDLER